MVVGCSKATGGNGHAGLGTEGGSLLGAHAAAHAPVTLPPSRLRKTVQLYEVKPRPAAAAGLDAAAGVGEFVDGVGRALALAGVQTARRWNAAAFEDYVDARMSASWQQVRRA